MAQQNVVILGASPKEDRYSNKALKKLLEHNHRVFPVHPICPEIHGQKCYAHLNDITLPVDTLTLYVGKDTSTDLSDTILKMKPRRIIMNPGAENDVLEKQALAQGIDVVRGCTLVMLSTQQFDFKD